MFGLLFFISVASSRITLFNETDTMTCDTSVAFPGPATTKTEIACRTLCRKFADGSNIPVTTCIWSEPRELCSLFSGEAVDASVCFRVNKRMPRTQTVTKPSESASVATDKPSDGTADGATGHPRGTAPQRNKTSGIPRPGTASPGNKTSETVSKSPQKEDGNAQQRVVIAVVSAVLGIIVVAIVMVFFCHRYGGFLHNEGAKRHTALAPDVTAPIAAPPPPHRKPKSRRLKVPDGSASTIESEVPRRTTVTFSPSS